MKRKAACFTALAAAALLLAQGFRHEERPLRDAPLSLEAAFDQSLREVKDQALAQARAPATVPYYRFWRGVPLLPQDEFLRKIPDFIRATRTWLISHQGVAYLPAIPLEGAPGGIGEVALVAYASREDYERERATPEGQAYQDLHWTLFDRARSKSGAPVALEGVIAPETPYDVLGLPVDWQSGCSSFFFGLRGDGVAPADFLAKLHQHVMDAKALAKHGMDGYLIVATDQYEIAYQHWPRCDAEAAFQTEDGKRVSQGAQTLFKPSPMQWIGQVPPFNGALQPGQAANVLFPRD